MSTEGTPLRALSDALLSLCDDLPGEPPALIAWGPLQLAEALTKALDASGWVVAKRTQVRRGGAA